MNPRYEECDGGGSQCLQSFYTFPMQHPTYCDN